MLMEAFVAELVGTCILVVLGDGVVANVVLARTKGNQSGWIVITAGWGLAVAIAVYSVGRISGAHINPAVTIGLAAIGQFPWANVWAYVLAQLVGAFLGAVVVWISYRPHWAATDDAEAKLGVFATGPEIRSPGANLVTEMVGTAVLVFGVLAIAANAGEMTAGTVDLSSVFATGINPMLVGVLVWSLSAAPLAMPSTPLAISDHGSRMRCCRSRARGAPIGAMRGSPSWGHWPAACSARWRFRRSAGRRFT